MTTTTTETVPAKYEGITVRDFFRRHADACTDAKAYCRRYTTMAEAWDAAARSDWMMRALGWINYNDDAKLRLYACRAVRETPLPDGRKVWDLLTDERSRRAVEVAEKYAVGKATQEELAAAWAAGRAAGRAAAWAAAWAAGRDAAWAAGRDAAWAAQANMLREIIGNPFRIEG